MKHARRMIMVPEDVYARFEQKQKLQASPIVRNMINTDTEMSNILQRTDLNDAEKQKLYSTNLERYLNLKQQKDNQIPSVRVVSNAENKEEPKERAQLSDALVVEHIPKTMRPRATTLLNRLKARPDIISWDESGQVSVEGKKIPQSNISDLVSDAMRARKNFNPTGSREFFRVLSKINMPKDLVRNEERWKQVDSSPGREDPSTKQVDSSPGREDHNTAQVASPSNYFQTLQKRHEERKQTQKRWTNY